MKRLLTIGLVLSSGLLAACATAPPPELVDARAAYEQARTGPAEQWVPAEVHKAHEALAQAELSFTNAPDSYETRNLAYVAQRKAQLAEALAVIVLEDRTRKRSDDEYSDTQRQLVQRAREALDQSRAALAEAQSKSAKTAAQLEAERQARMAAEQNGAQVSQQLDQERQARLDAEKKASEAQLALARLGEVKEEQRGLVLTLNGSVLFASDQSLLLPAAQSRLAEVADALLLTRDRNIIVEGHTDSRGSDSYNVDLSQRRAEAVRDYVVSRGYPAERIVAVGLGKETPIADNSSPEGRANNRRVEIIVVPIRKLSANN